MIKTFTLRKKHFNPSLPVTDREYVTGVVVGDYVKVYSDYNKWDLYCLTSQTTYIPTGIGEKESVQMMNKRDRLLLEHFDITDIVYFKSKKELYEHLKRHYNVHKLDWKQTLRNTNYEELLFNDRKPKR